MARPRKGARLYLRANRVDKKTGRTLAPIYFIRDGGKSISTGCGPDRLDEAEAALAEYLSERRAESARGRAQDPEDVLIDDVIALYAREKAPRAADPTAVAARLSVIMEWWSGKTLAEIRRSSCQAYVAHRCAQPVRSFKCEKVARRVSPAGARRELEDLSAAVTYWAAEHALTRLPVFSYPEKAPGSRDALSRTDAAALIRAARGWRRDASGRWHALPKSTRSNRAHLVRFILIGLYTGTRPGVLPKLRWTPSDDSPYVDLQNGWVFRRGRMEADRPTKRRPICRLPKRLLRHMAHWRLQDEGLSLERAKLGLPPIETVLHHGGREIRGRIRRGYNGVVTDAGLDRRITPHWHRHTAATWLMEAGVPLQQAAQYLGMTIHTLESKYGHHRPDFQNDVAAAIERSGRHRL